MELGVCGMKRKGFLVLALLCGMIAALSTFFFLRNNSKTAVVAIKPLVVAKTNIPARSVIDSSQLVIRDVPKQGYPQGGAAKISDVSGAVSLVNLKPGDVILSSEVELATGLSTPPPAGANSQASTSGSGAPVTPTLSVPEGKRAMAIPVNLISSVAYNVKPGDHVDILATMDIPAAGQPSQSSGTAATVTVTSLVAQDVLVLSTGDGKSEAKAYVLALSVPEAMAVDLASEKGSLRLLLRNPANQEIRQDTPIGSNVFLDPKYLSGLSGK